MERLLVLGFYSAVAVVVTYVGVVLSHCHKYYKVVRGLILFVD